jgi:malate/lactate dehydrogenase
MSSFTKCYYSSGFKPMDTMTYLALKSTGLPKNRIIGMGGALDSSVLNLFVNGVGKTG